MKKVYQKYYKKGENTDCWRACIASITEIEINELPDPNNPLLNIENHWLDYYQETIKVLNKNGWDLERHSIQEYENKDNGLCIAIGKSPRGKYNHAVVWGNGIEFDPHPFNQGIVNIKYFEHLIKLES